MAVVTELHVASDSFPLGTLLTANDEFHVEFERLVPAGGQVLPIFWAWGGEFDSFESRVRSSRFVDDLTVVERVQGRTLYSVVWNSDVYGFVDGLAEANGVILHARGYDDQSWNFRLLFHSHERLSSFHDYFLAHDVPFTLGRLQTLSEANLRDERIDLTNEQREALFLAFERGYFDSPSRVTLTELADELEITQQALSQRIRRGNEQLLEHLFADELYA
ncbi:helix-turn-helix domain-containing protein [Haloprofundus halophilus]|uniref:helix-turn-helix domain-containing protein n=1 Tax=Haloprofundus halophilus TaxID=2283527 RepID=UPI000E448D8B|nr:helix-turn-helix domain-containing protein [Haloprofundus halophilus]